MVGHDLHPEYLPTFFLGNAVKLDAQFVTDKADEQLSSVFRTEYDVEVR